MRVISMVMRSVRRSRHEAMEDAAMSRVDVEIPAPDGVAKGSLHVPDGDGPGPGVLVFPDHGGRRSMPPAGGIGDKIAAAASFHGGRIAVADDPKSPHLAADRIAATVYGAGAVHGAPFPDQQGAL